MFPLLAALPDDGADAGLDAVPDDGAAAGRGRWRWRAAPAATRRCAGTTAPLRGCAGGMLAGLLFGILAALAGGAVGPGPDAATSGRSRSTSLVHAVTAFGIGGLVGGLVVTWWQRRAADVNARRRRPSRLG